ncbi:hypothetical protein [Flavobacterium geliluteum]|uniref:Uncharacterized protein n=1 Tax=Flavobacterium geliluteum TaxID=2816120 RepID=A0A941B0B5_9FLAO|nr:hypothetical protein [Flavobacterium geliluteum]MBP4139977.1 hypothetical protein [Flavobacterium geliluteum]
MKIIIKTNADGLQAVNKLLATLEYYGMTTSEQLTLKSIARDVALKFEKKWETARDNQTLFDVKKKYSIALKYHEAYAPEKLIMTLIGTCDDVRSKTALNKIKDFINQKMV